MTLLRGGHVYAPEDMGQQDILIAGQQIVAVQPKIEPPRDWPFLSIVEASGLLVMPGLIDGHIHLIGGGGEGGPETRNRDILLGQIITAGVTTVLGMIGVDCETRSVETLLAKARALTIEGITAYILTGGYVYPTPTLTGSITKDIAFIREVIGVGEIAIADHRSSQPTLDELAKVAAAARMGGLLGKKAGIFVVHIGNGEKGLTQLVELARTTEIPITQYLPTHVNRSAHLLQQAIGFMRMGGNVEVTAGIAPHLGFPQALKASEAIRQMLEAGTDPDHITLSSDANGNMPVFDAQGNVIGLEVQAVTHTYNEWRDLVQKEGFSIPDALRFVTVNPARILRLSGKKGRLAAGYDADVLLTEPDLAIHSLYGMGKPLIWEGKQVAFGVYEGSFQERVRWKGR